jgi:hypothetical protein
MPLIHRLKTIPDLLGVGKTKLRKDFILHNPADPFIPHTGGVRRLQTVPLGSQALGVTDVELNRVVDALRRRQGARKRKADNAATGVEAP